MTLPLGLVYDEDGTVAFDPDRQLVEAIRRVFTAFRDKGSAMQVVKWFRDENILLPHRTRTGPSRGILRWSLPDHAKIRRILRNPAYAGAFTYGKTRTLRQADGSVRYRTLPREQWEVCIPGHHAGFIDWEEYGRNLETMARNARSFAAVPGPPQRAAQRRGPAAGPGAVWALRRAPEHAVQQGATGSPPTRAGVLHVQANTQRYGKKACQSIPAEAVDAAVGRFAVAAMNRENIALALAVQEQVRADFAEADAQRALRIERRGYEAELAQRRYYAVDPVNRLVAAPLEAAWNERLRDLEEAVRERDERREARDEEMSAEQVRRIEALARDFAQVWDAPATDHVDRKRLLRLLVEDATLAREGYEARVELRLRGGKALALDPVPLNRPRNLQHPVCPATVAALDAALDTHSDAEAAELLNQAGHRRWNGAPYTVRDVYRLRQRVGMKGHLERRQAALRAQGYLTAGELARQMGLCASSVRSLGRQGRILREQINTGRRPSALYKLPPGYDHGKHGAASASPPASETSRPAGDARLFGRDAS